ncbi:hypothetical protein B0J11DRAFT_500718 [Dendryphion nanum]|uniref:HMG box domain-containing protein n=1 Tax=Dendryphion nanum TaxID=256645 RepID=A0A9P9EJ99_9PLEO|nr:hypothetical protein B0J11DRAFT_500718 [Dendryphion nanum]
MARQKKDTASAETTELLVSVEQFVRTVSTLSPPPHRPHFFVFVKLVANHHQRDSARRDSPTRPHRSQPATTVPVSREFTTYNQKVIVALTNLQTGLAHVQNGLNDLLRAYMTHTASILAGEGGTLENLQLPPHIAANATAAAEAAQTAGSAIAQAITAPIPGTAGLAGATAAGPAAVDPKQKKRKREKKTRDPNAPKRPLTAAFLFAQSARPIVKQDLEGELESGHKLEPNAVNLEVTKRWNEMAEEDKEKWRQSYRESMEKWKLESEIYKNSGLAAPFAQDDEDPSDEAEGGAIDSDVEVESEDDDEAAAAAAAAKETTPPAAGKTPRPNKRQKTVAAQVNGTSHASATGPAAAAAAGSPSKQTPILPPSAEAPAAAAKKDRKKKAPAAQAIAPAPAAQPEPAPEDIKKKAKSGRTTRNAAEVEVETPAAAVVEKTPAAKKSRSSKRKSEAAASS